MSGALKFIPDWFVTSKMLEMFNNALLANDDILFFNKVTFFANQIDILIVDRHKINPNGDNNLILILLFMSNFWLGIVNLKNAKHLKKDERRINACSVASSKMVELVLPEDEKKEVEPFFLRSVKI